MIQGVPKMDVFVRESISSFSKNVANDGVGVWVGHVHTRVVDVRIWDAGLTAVVLHKLSYRSDGECRGNRRENNTNIIKGAGQEGEILRLKKIKRHFRSRVSDG